MLFKLKEYLFFILKSTNKHGVHSPFVYKLITLCFDKEVSKKGIKTFYKYRQQLLDNKQRIKVTDFGAGSQVFKSNQREIAKIAKVAGVSTKKATLLIKLVSYFQFKNILEIGTSLGLGTTAMCAENKTSVITTLEGCSKTAKIAQQQFNEFGFKNIKLIVGDFKETLPKAIESQKFDLIYFDGNHQKKPTLQYFETCLETAHNDSVFVFDDIHWSKEMKEAWQIIKQHPKVRVTVDVFHWGIVFFRTEQEKQHFTIRV